MILGSFEEVEPQDICAARYLRCLDYIEGLSRGGKGMGRDELESEGEVER